MNTYSSLLKSTLGGLLLNHRQSNRKDKDGHQCSPSQFVTAALVSKFPTVQRAALRWTISILEICSLVCGPHTAEAYCNWGLSVLLKLCRLSNLYENPDYMLSRV